MDFLALATTVAGVLMALAVIVLARIGHRERLLEESAEGREGAVDERQGSLVSNQATPDEMLAAALAQIRQSARDTAERTVSPLAVELDDRKQLLRAATERAEKLGVTRSVMGIWQNLADLPDLQPLKSETRRDENHEIWTRAFAYGGAQYRFTLSVQRSAPWLDGTVEYGEIAFEVAGEGEWLSVFQADVSRDGTREFSPWVASNVTVLKVGEWIAPITSLDELLAGQRRRERIEAELEFYDRKVINLRD